MGTPEAAKARSAATFNAAAAHFDDAANTFWDRFGRGSVAPLGLRPGAQVLDVCCGSGASAIPAAQAVGPGGRVLAVDLAENLLALGRAKAQRLGLENIEFRVGDMLALGQPDGSFDAVVCVFGIFFVPDMAAALRALWAPVRPGGQLAITTWGPRVMEPLNTAFWESVRALRPDLYRGFNPWDRIVEPGSLAELFASAGLPPAQITPVSGWHDLPNPEAWWSLVLGTGYRGTLDQLDEAGRERVRQENFDAMKQQAVSAVETNVMYAVVNKAAA